MNIKFGTNGLGVMENWRKMNVSTRGKTEARRGWADVASAITDQVPRKRTVRAGYSRIL
jgi:hypothetical protein